jgi:glutaredoxin 3
MADVRIFTTPICPYCVQAKRLLDHKQITYVEVDVSGDYALLEEMIAASGRRTVPQIFIGGRSIGGYEDLRALDRSGELDTLLGGG